MTPLRLVLASTSPYRRDLLARLGLPFDCADPAVDETSAADAGPAARADRLAREKALAVAGRLGTGLVIGADQVAACAGRVLHKPGDATRAREQLALCAGRTVVFHTAIALADAASGRVRAARRDVAVRFRALSATEIADYVAADRPFDCAGSLRAEGLGITLLEGIDCDDPTAIIGLPLIAVAGLLREAGVTLPGPVSAAPSAP